MTRDLQVFIEDYNQIPLVIGELGINHQGSIDIARSLIAGAAHAGIHAIKFQYRNLMKSYSQDSNEIGDEILKVEIERNFISPEEIIILASEARKLGMWVGISFFIVDDCADFGEKLFDFDFFKIPSVELMNADLIDYLVSLKKPVLISTGAHWEAEIETALSRISGPNWYPLHCVSNYPVAPHNSNLSYLSRLKSRWNRPVGFSSHESDWEYVLIALRHNPRIIERHLTIDKSLPGLDQSTSSDLKDFAKMMKILTGVLSDKSTSSLSRVPNQGELLNRQNLGRGFYFSHNQNLGEVLDEEKLIYRSPQIGIDKPKLKNLSSKILVESGISGSPLLKSHFTRRSTLTAEDIQFANDLELAIPVRLHDFEQVLNEIPVKSLELHLSFSEVEKLDKYTNFFNDQKLSLHLPDYISPLQLIDPVSTDPLIATRSLEIIGKASDFVKEVQDKTGYEVLIVGSFPMLSSLKREAYFEKYAAIQNDLRNEKVSLTMQWLPPFAWYFGGSEPLKVFNTKEDVDLINTFEIDVCMDISHLLLGSNYFQFEPNEILKTLENRIKYFHLSDAVGFDGEGSHFDLNDQKKCNIFRYVLDKKVRKTLEVWQGHFDFCEGFKRAIWDLRKMLTGGNHVCQ